MKPSFLLTLLPACVALVSVTLAAGQEALPAGVQIGMAYQEAKLRLQNQGWQPAMPSASDSVPFQKQPEIECGQGNDAVCSVGFQKGKEFVALTVKEKNHVLFVSGSY